MKLSTVIFAVMRFTFGWQSSAGSYAQRAGNTDTLTSLLNSILNLSAVRMVDLDASDLTRYGLSEPRYQFKLGALSGKEVVVSIGDSAGNGQYYVTSSACQRS